MSVAIGKKRTLYFDLETKLEAEGVAKILRVSHVSEGYTYALVLFEGESISKWRRIYVG